MTREQFIKKYKNDCHYYFDGYYSDCIDDFLTNIYNDHEAQLKSKDEEIDRTKSYIEKLWQIIDDIDTYGDMAKSDDAMFRSLVENKQEERWELPITTDGYKLIYKDTK